MPRRRCGAGWGGPTAGGACPRRISRFLEPCLLLLLRGNAAHGYNLLEALQQFGFAAGTLDASIVYRVLREMEDAGWVASAWQMPVSGPPRRVYQVTADGSDYLNWWITDLRRTRDEITGFLELYEARGETPSDGAAGAEHPTEPEESTQDTKGGRDL